MGTDDPPVSKTKANDNAPAPSSKSPIIVENPDGTFTIQIKPAEGQSNGLQSKNGLVIPAQVVVPLVRTHEKKD
jgi:hypothetical protein